jgi:hypothetical protein
MLIYKLNLKKELGIELSTPINLHSYTIKDTPLKKLKTSQTTFEPRLTVNYDINSIGKLTRQEFRINLVL